MRLLLPIEFPYTRILNSENVLPMIYSLINKPLFHLGHFNICFVQILLTLWFSIAFFITVKHMIDYYRLKHLLKLVPDTLEERFHTLLYKVDSNSRKVKNVKIIIDKGVHSPAIIGFVKPIILLPDISFSDDELYGILIHEWTHYKSGHIYIKCLAEIIRSFFWWNPVFKDLSTEVAHALELHSDKKVCITLNKKQQSAYLNAIMKVLSNIPSQTRSSSMSCGLVEERESEKITQRFKMILEHNYARKDYHDLLAIPIICLLFVTSYIVVPQPYYEPSVESFGDMDDVSDGSFLLKVADGYELYDSANNFISKVTYLDESLIGLEIYENMEEKLEKE